MAQGYFYKGKDDNYYYDVDKYILYSYDRYTNGTEGETYTEHSNQVNLTFEDFLKQCITIENCK